MLNLQDTRIVYAMHEAVATGAVIAEEGLPLAYVMEDGERKVKVATAAAGEVYAGVAYARFTPPSRVPVVEDVEIEADGTIRASRVPAAGALAVFVEGAKLTVVTVAPQAGEVQYSGTESLKVEAALGGSIATLQYQYSPTVEEARTFVGDLPIGGLGVAEAGTVGTLKNAEFGTSFFDASADWNGVMYVKLGAGVFVPGTANDRIPGVLVKRAPVQGSAFLVLTSNIA